MTERDIGTFFSGWLKARRKDENCTPEEYVTADYLRMHPQENAAEEELENGQSNQEAVNNAKELQKREIQDRIECWKASEAAFLEDIADVKMHSQLESWQAYEMLQNVILELDLNVKEEYEFLANVKKMLYDTLLPVLGKHYTEEIREEVEASYQSEWERAQSGVDSIDAQKLFAQTASLMQYVGVTYEEETQIILSEIAMGKEILFKREQGKADWDVRLFTNYLVSEMVLSDEQGQYTDEEKQIMVEQVLPVYTVALSEHGNEDAHTSQRMAQAQQYLFRLLPSGKFRLFAGLAVIIVAVHAVISLAMTAVVGIVVFGGLKSVWDLCKKVWDKKTVLETTPVTEFLKKKIQEMHAESDRKAEHAEEAYEKESEYEDALESEYGMENAEHAEKEKRNTEDIEEDTEEKKEKWIEMVEK